MAVLTPSISFILTPVLRKSHVGQLSFSHRVRGAILYKDQHVNKSSRIH